MTEGDYNLVMIWSPAFFFTLFITYYGKGESATRSGEARAHSTREEVSFQTALSLS